MRHSEFWQLMDDEFGVGYSRTLAHDLVLEGLGSHTAEQALATGEKPRTVWFALCDAMQVPPERRWGTDPKARPRSG